MTKTSNDTSSLLGQCGSCRYWSKYRDDMRDHGQCRINPPTAVPVGFRVHAQEWASGWPTTQSGQGCGSFRSNDVTSDLVALLMDYGIDPYQRLEAACLVEEIHVWARNR